MANFEVTRYNTETECAVSLHDSDHSKIEFSWLKTAKTLVIARYDNDSDLSSEQVMVNFAEVLELLKFLLWPEMQKLFARSA